MNVTRRQALKSIAAVAGVSSTGLLAGFGPIAAAEIASPPKATTVIVSIDTIGQTFLNRIRAQRDTHISQVLNSSTDLSFVRDLQRVLANGQTQRVVGLVDDASATLILDLARSANASLVWDKSHSQLSEADAALLGQTLGSFAPQAIHTRNGRHAKGHYVSFMLEI